MPYLRDPIEQLNITAKETIAGETHYRPLERDNRLEAYSCWHCDSPGLCTLYITKHIIRICFFFFNLYKNRINSPENKIEKHRPVISAWGAATHLQTPMVFAGTETLRALQHSEEMRCLAAQNKRKERRRGWEI